MTRATGRRPNRLATEKSPYLLQHAANPVDWFPWGAEAFAEAKRRDVPIFLSIGYSTCHWCHVMEEESFEDEATARILNERFVSVKLDREERPDVDDHYMQAVVAMTGAGGWPMTVFLDHELRPFFGGTYFPPEDRWGRPGFRTLLLRISELWGSRRADVLASGRQLDDELRRSEGDAGGAGQPPDAATVVDRAVTAWQGRFDAAHGGFGGAPKFPPHLALDALLGHAARTGEARSRTMVERTLDAMAAGGIHDQLGGGFHRYSTDGVWLVPHFEKMLYDNALLAGVYLEASRRLGRPDDERVGRRILDWILRDMTAPDGGFLSARDADDPGGEGSHYVWTAAQLDEVLGVEDGALVAARFGVDAAGNFEVEGSRSGDRPPRRGSILSVRATVDELAARFSLEGPDVARRLEAAVERLREARDRRPAPSTDDKVLTDWNGLAISAFAAGWRVTRDARYLRAAERAAGFLLGTVRRDGGLLHRWRDGDAAIPGFLTDWAFLAQGLLDLAEASLEPRWYLEADDLAQEAVRRFGDGRGRFFLTEGPGEIGRRIGEDWDGAIPTGASVLLGVLVRLAALRGEPEGGETARSLLSAMAGRLERQPTALARALSALEWRLAGGRVVVLAGDRGTPSWERFLERLYGKGPLGAIVVPADAALSERFPVIRGKESTRGEVLAFVCRDLVCEAPTGDPERLAASLAAPSGPATAPRRDPGMT